MKINQLDITKPGRPKESESILEELGAPEIESLPEDLGNDEIEILDSDNLDNEDPIRLYLRQIGRIPLLNVADEKLTARKIEIGIHIAEVKFDLETKQTHPTASMIFQEIIRNIGQSADIIHTLRKRLSLPGNTNFYQIVAYAGAKRRRDRLNPTPWPENTDTPAAKSDNLFICARGDQPEMSYRYPYRQCGRSGLSQST
jgi:hypothetical protein